MLDAYAQADTRTAILGAQAKFMSALPLIPMVKSICRYTSEGGYTVIEQVSSLPERLPAIYHRLTLWALMCRFYCLGSARVFLYVALLVSCLCSGFSLRKDKEHGIGCAHPFEGVPFAMNSGRLAGFCGCFSTWYSHEDWTVTLVVAVGLALSFCYWRWRRQD